jgi:hypothetical protein
MKRMFYSKPPLAHDFAVVEDDINIAIPQQEAGESIDPEDSTDAGPDTADNSLEERDDEDNESMSDSLTGPTPAISTRLGRTISKPTRLIEEAGIAMPDLEIDLEEYKIKLSCAKEHSYKAMRVLHEGEFISKECWSWHWRRFCQYHQRAPHKKVQTNNGDKIYLQLGKSSRQRT